MRKLLTVVVILLLGASCVALALQQRQMQHELAELKESIGNHIDAQAEENRWAWRHNGSLRRYFVHLVETNPNLLLSLIDYDINEIDAGRADTLVRELRLGGGGGGQTLELLDRALKLGASRYEVERRFDRLASLAEEGRPNYEADPELANAFRVMKVKILH